MYAVIKTGGKQYRVQPGDLLVVEKLAGEPGADVAFGEVLMLGEGEAVTVGAPTVAGASVSATLIETRKGEKVKIFKKIRRQGYRRTKGHRQLESVLRVTAIAGADGQQAKWDGKVDLTTKAELNARARGLVFVSPQAQLDAAAAARVQVQRASAAKPAQKARPAAKAPKAADVEVAAKAAQVSAPVSEAPATEAAATEAPKAKAAPAKKAAAPKAGAGEKKAAAPKKAPAAAKKDKPAE
jgi:large subunit ribosomal protein L21